MRIALLGGTRFIGRTIAAELAAAGHDLLLCHRGENEPDDLPAAAHAHLDRRDVAGLRAALAGRDALVDTCALSRADAETALAAAPEARLLVLSSMDVYRAYSALHAGGESQAVPLDESSPLRTERYPYRGVMPGLDDYEKIEVEEAYLARGATVLRLPMVYGEHDYQRREEFVLRRVRAGRSRIPIGAGNWLWTRGYAGDIARAVRLALEREVSGEVLNLGERRTASMERWAHDILDAAGSTAELVRVPDALLPDDMKLTAGIAQHMLVDSSRARALLGWEPEDAQATLRRSVAWHLAHPPADQVGFEADDRALAAA
ncbi:MAG TPA: NAD-dependent epimerase/dehydratase family protein [Kofleriaceae bacterium]|nr:NAD-dependent epimerase/dehydratase family protein [Kofleriaceae bacterium]